MILSVHVLLLILSAELRRYLIHGSRTLVTFLPVGCLGNIKNVQWVTSQRTVTFGQWGQRQRWKSWKAMFLMYSFRKYTRKIYTSLSGTSCGGLMVCSGIKMRTFEFYLTMIERLFNQCPASPSGLILWSWMRCVAPLTWHMETQELTLPIFENNENQREVTRSHCGTWCLNMVTCSWGCPYFWCFLSSRIVIICKIYPKQCAIYFLLWTPAQFLC